MLKPVHLAFHLDTGSSGLAEAGQWQRIVEDRACRGRWVELSSYAASDSRT
jgi:hypothetical protein